MTVQDSLIPEEESLVAAQMGVVDVIIAAWNRADTIERAIRSVGSEAAVRSVIVVDDASGDDTASIAERLRDELPKLKVLRLTHNGGPSAARNVAIAQSKADWIAILDGDDYQLAGRFDRLLAAAGDADFIADDLLVIDENPAPGIGPQPLLQIDASWPDRVTLADFALGNISRRGRNRREMGFLKPLMRRAFLKQHHLAYDEAVRLGEDFLLYAGALAAGARFRLLPAAGYVAVQRATSLSGRHRRVDLEALLHGDRQLLALPNLQPAERRALTQHCLHIEGKVRWLLMIEAVKRRDIAGCLETFKAPPVVGLDLLGKLTEQLYLRGSRRLRWSFGLRDHAQTGLEQRDAR